MEYNVLPIIPKKSFDFGSADKYCERTGGLCQKRKALNLHTVQF
jgi:hypothetical protein